MTINVFGGGFDPAAPAFPLQRSVRLRSSASAYFNRTPASAGNRTTWTWSAWVKRGVLTTARQDIFGVDNSNLISFQSSGGAGDSLSFENYNGAGADYYIRTTAVYRDPSAWYHIVAVWDSNNATAGDRQRLYVNGVQVTGTTGNSIPSGATSVINSATNTSIGRNTAGGFYFDGYLTEVNFIDGQALTPTSFGSINSTTGVWQPIKYSGTYGTNGFYLNFQDNSGATATTIGKDSSGNGNNWTPNNISVTAGVTYDSMLDVPTLTSATNANFCTLNPLVFNPTYCSDGNLNFAGANLTSVRASFAIPTSGKWYWELNQIDAAVNYVGFGIADSALTTGSNNAGTTAAGMWSLYPTTAMNYSMNGATAVNTGVAPPALGGCMACAYDANTGYIWFGYAASGAGSITWFASGDPATGANPLATISSGRTLLPFVSSNNTTSNKSGINFGQRPFNCTPPSGFKSLNTYNLPAPTIPNGATQFAATTYTGNGSTQSITNTVNGKSFQPDFVWIKGRSVAYDNQLTDSVRGVGKELQSNATNSESSFGLVSALNSNGFTVFTNGTYLASNQNGTTYVGWQWKAGGTAVTNTAGSITSQVSANPSAGFSIVTYTGTGSAGATVGHGLNIKPSLIIVKQRTTASTTAWAVYHSALDSGDSTNSAYLLLNSANAKADVTTGDAETVFGNGAVWKSPTSSVFTIGANGVVNASSGTYVAYCFSEIAGYSKFGSYSGNNSATDGAFVYLGFRPRFLLIKSTSAGTSWVMMDSARNTYNLSDTSLYTDSANSEAIIGTVNDIDFLSNGFKLRNNTGFVNASQTYVYAAFAESPFNYSLAR